MAIVRKWTEVEDECLGPDKANAHWVMYLFIHLCVEYSRKTKRGLIKYIRRGKTIKLVEGKLKRNVLVKAEEYLAQSDVVLLPTAQALKESK